MTHLILPKDVQVVITEHAARFVGASTFEALSCHPVFIDQFALGEEGDIRHISLADSADLLLVAPATANTLGKLARGIADDALSTLFLATTAPVLVAPAMNVNMFRHPAVIENLEMLRARGAGIVAMAAAVSDYRPAEKATSKVKKQDGGQKLDLVRTPDILKSLGESKQKRFLIGFAAETERLLESARKKRAEKRVDLMVANDVS